jgi:hypothetical protein
MFDVKKRLYYGNTSMESEVNNPDIPHTGSPLISSRGITVDGEPGPGQEVCSQFAHLTDQLEGLSIPIRL